MTKPLVFNGFQCPVHWFGLRLIPSQHLAWSVDRPADKDASQAHEEGPLRLAIAEVGETNWSWQLGIWRCGCECYQDLENAASTHPGFVQSPAQIYSFLAACLWCLWCRNRRRLAMFNFSTLGTCWMPHPSEPTCLLAKKQSRLVGVKHLLRLVRLLGSAESFELKRGQLGQLSQLGLRGVFRGVFSGLKWAYMMSTWRGEVHEPTVKKGRR